MSEQSTASLMNLGRSSMNPSMTVDSSIDEYLEDPNLSISEMIEQYDVPMITDNQQNEKKTLRCVVCDGHAYGFNFDQISCESCKAFFRRNALRNMNEFQCRFSGNCNITVETRRHCSSCRIKKCFTMGMRKESIRSEEEKYMKRLQIDKNRRRRLQQLIELPVSMAAKNTDILIKLSPSDRTRVNNITHCYDTFTGEPSTLRHIPPRQLVQLRLDEFFNRKKPILINLTSYFKHLPELKTINVDDQVTLIKHNIRLLMPLNYAILKTPTNSTFRDTSIQTVGCVNNINLHEEFCSLSNSYVEFVVRDPIFIKLFLIVLFFSTNSLTTRSIYDPAQYKQLNNIKQIQTSYIELLWLYMIDKCGERDAINILTKMVTKYLYLQVKIEEIDGIVRMNDDIRNIDALVQSFLHLT